MPFTDLINLDNIEGFSRLGVFKEEKEKGQIIKVNLSMSLDLRKSAASDELADTIDYGEVSKLVRETAAKKEYSLVEHLAQEIINDVFENFKMITALKVKVFKPTIISEGFSGDVSVELIRRK